MSYSHNDEALRDKLATQLTILERNGLIDVWYDRQLLPGDQLDQSINIELDKAHIVLLLISADFFASDYCMTEMKRTLDRHRDGTVKLIPVILRPCDWKQTELGGIVAAPKDGIPITDWENFDKAFLDVAQSIRHAITEVSQTDTANLFDKSAEKNVPANVTGQLISSPNLHIRKEFSEAEKDNFLLETFECVDGYFQRSLQELQAKHAEIETRFRRIDANSFTATIYRHGSKENACTVRIGGSFGGITYSGRENAPDNTANEIINVYHDNQHLFLKTMGMSFIGSSSANGVLNRESAAEYLWSLLIQRLQ